MLHVRFNKLTKDLKRLKQGDESVLNDEKNTW